MGGWCVAAAVLVLFGLDFEVNGFIEQEVIERFVSGLFTVCESVVAPNGNIFV